MSQSQAFRSLAVIAVRGDGRRAALPLSSADVAIRFLGVLEVIGLGLLALITGSRRESGGMTEADR